MYGLVTSKAKHFASMRSLNRVVWLAFCTCFFALSSLAAPTEAGAETRKLKLYFLHTGERAEITFKKNGKYSASGVKKINRFLRDWRRNEPTKMNPKLLDLIWEVYKETGSRKHIHVISGYRSPKTNSLLRKRGRGVARKSQHTLGNALDFFIPGVSLRKLRNIGLKKGIGGVGYYPKSGSPFVHMDTGRVRHWPRMSRQELVKVFPKGKTLHVPTDGKPLARYNQAKAEYERRSKGKIVIAKAEEIEKKPGFFARLLGRNDEEDGIESDAGAIPAPKPVTTTKPASTTPAAPTPSTPTLEATPVPQTPELVLASLPTSALPIPVVAPRVAVSLPEPAQPELPQNDPIAAEVKPLTEPELVPEVQPEPEGVEDAPLLVAAVPTKRPQGLVPTVVAEVEPQNLEVAAIQPTALLPDTSQKPSSLTPGEIEDLRQQVYSAISASRETPAAPTPSIGVGIAAPTPAVPLTQEPTVVAALPSTASGTSDLLGVVVPKPNPGRVAAKAIEQQLALQTIDGGENAQNKIAVPQASPREIAKPEIEEAVTLAVVEEPIEPGVTTSGNPALPAPNPNRSIEIAALTDNRTVGVVPTRATRKPLPVASQPTLAEVVTTPETEENVLTLEQFQSANLDDRLVGKWALAADASIADIADIRPPAYGKNIIRELPDTVLSTGFSQNLKSRLASEGFSGSSLEFLDFTRFK